MERIPRFLKGLEMSAWVSTAINLLLAVNFYRAVPFLGWLNYGHRGTPSWIPKAFYFSLFLGPTICMGTSAWSSQFQPWLPPSTNSSLSSRF